MRRREFLKLVAQGSVVLCMAPFGCGSDSNAPPGRDPCSLPYETGIRYLFFDRAGNHYEVLPDEHRVVRLAEDGSILWEIGGLGSELGNLNYPICLAAGPDDRLYIVDLGASLILACSTEGEPLFEIGQYGTGDDQLNYPTYLTIDDAGILYVCDALNHRIQVFDPEGAPIRRFGSLGTEGADFNYPETLAIAPDGRLHIVDAGNARVQVYEKTGTYVGAYGSYGESLGQFITPCSIVIDSRGYRYVADAMAGHVTVFSPFGHALCQYWPKLPDGSSGFPLNLVWSPDDMIYMLLWPAGMPV